jgi:mannose/fructose/N-acetylgalactosamine-specific phosphotransferase system component IIB
VAAYATRVIVVKDGLIRSDTRQTPIQAVVPPEPLDANP